MINLEFQQEEELWGELAELCLDSAGHQLYVQHSSSIQWFIGSSVRVGILNTYHRVLVPNVFHPCVHNNRY